MSALGVFIGNDSNGTKKGDFYDDQFVFWDLNLLGLGFVSMTLHKQTPFSACDHLCLPSS